ncbi:glycosyltransferase family 4 protein [Lactobacillus taiwanensis]|jgi:Glycosyltransferase|uniref:glycosyltransferase family 4 protein n=1 Tax=Lactobacillus taiwanensis TaxID=508451 RepID=UPI000B99182D|nr:glycosyltransferase family 4 protein [Lactobacillus taiwanensis]OYR96826.1 glycosyl transferase family 1 [Lactobacillus taiwanensis]OYS01860.1 glycosyl transferase family 1 [Lactobacillus taiwanensis]OYS14039.1 glycosyl transferase family 1 [Lactobacillus taiwanensis]OYS33779.1 glycosyl transferase family 1 [Lactobacillus taiwanensis]OYS33835.1 glycosyl transferase family 1 [Lactobacillus taiwanensis]
MKTILYLHAGAEMYGADKILLELVSGLDKTKFRPIVILPTDGVLRKKLEEENIFVHVISYPILRRKYFNPKGIADYISNYKSKSDDIIKFLDKNDIKIDLIHVNTLAVLEGIRLKNKLDVPLYWHIHEIITHPKIINKFLCWCVNHYADRAIVVSGPVKQHLINSGVNANKIKVIHNGIDSDIFSPKVKSNYLYKEWNIPQNTIKVGMIGRVNNWKGQEDFLDSLAPLLNEFDNLYLFIVGSAFKGQEWRIDDLKRKIKYLPHNNRIIFSEFRKDNYAVEHFFDILILPSTSPDPLPTVVLETMGCGRAVLGYAHGGITEMVKNQYNGELVSPLDKKALRKAVENCIISKKYKEWGENSRKRLLDNFSLDKFINNFEKIYKGEM